MGHSVEIANKIDSSFEGYYLLPMGFIIPESGNGIVKKNINEKVFLLSVINTNIRRMQTSRINPDRADLQSVLFTN